MEINPVPVNSFEELIENSQLIDRAFLERNSAVVARDLIGTIFVTRFHEGIAAARIVETEAYPGDDPASHVFNRLKPTPRTATQYANAGHLYMYLIMGLHHMTSVVTNKENVPDVVFIRAMEPLFGIDLMKSRRNYEGSDLRTLTAGPGKLSQAMGFTVAHQGLDIFSEDSFISIYSPLLQVDFCQNVKAGSRINLGVGKLDQQNAEIAINAQLRFYLSGSEFLS